MAMQHPYPVPDAGTGQGPAAPGAGGVPAKIPEMPAKLTPAEKRVWQHVTEALLECGLIHGTDGMALTVICRTFVRWVDAEEALTRFMKENKGSYIVRTPNGYEQPHQLFYAARTLKRELLQWLPEAALTIPSFQKAIDTAGMPEQGSLFGEDPVEMHRRRKTAISIRAV